MTKSTSALILTSCSALIAHISVYIPYPTMKYVISGVGAVLAIIGGVLLFSLRKPFHKEFKRSDWDEVGGDRGKEYQIRLDYSEHKKKSPNVSIEYLSANMWRNADDFIIAKANGHEDDIVLGKQMMEEAVRKFNFDGMDYVRVTIK